jgi:hypothetical protein
VCKWKSERGSGKSLFVNARGSTVCRCVECECVYVSSASLQSLPSKMTLYQTTTQMQTQTHTSQGTNKQIFYRNRNRRQGDIRLWGMPTTAQGKQHVCTAMLVCGKATLTSVMKQFHRKWAADLNHHVGLGLGEHCLHIGGHLPLLELVLHAVTHREATMAERCCTLLYVYMRAFCYLAGCETLMHSFLEE